MVTYFFKEDQAQSSQKKLVATSEACQAVRKRSLRVR